MAPDDMAPQAWSTEMQLATKTMLRSVNKQRLGRVKRPRKLKDALALESSPRDVKRAQVHPYFLHNCDSHKNIFHVVCLQNC